MSELSSAIPTRTPIKLWLPPEPKAAPTIALMPHTLTSGPESGLCNQIYALVGWTVIATIHKTALVLPNWTTHDRGGTSVTFDHLWEAEPFIARLRALTHVHAYQSVDALPSGMTVWRPTPREGGAIAGWRKYKSMHHVGANISAHERAVFLGLTPSRRLRARISAVQRALLRPASSVDADASGALSRGTRTPAYGCLHARIETDMLASWGLNRAGLPPTLDDFLSAMASVPHLRRLDVVFVAVGLAISEADDAVLDQPTRWGARLVRTREGKAWHRGHRNASQPSYIDAAIVDFAVCREAAWLVGWPGTTFGRTLAALQWYDHGRGWYEVCPGPSIRRIDRYDLHNQCLENNATRGAALHRGGGAAARGDGSRGNASRAG